MPTPSGFTTREIGISGGGDHHHSLEAAPMATTLTSECNLLVIPFSAATNFTTLADYCEHFAETIIECHDLALKMAPCGRLSTCLALLRPTLGEPIPPHLIDRFTVDVLPDVLPEFTPDADLLCDYCLALAQVLLTVTVAGNRNDADRVTVRSGLVFCRWSESSALDSYH